MIARPIFRFIALLVLLAGAAPLGAQETKPKLGPDAFPLLQAQDYLRSAPSPDFWRLVAFYVPQETSSACSVASVAMVVNALRGLPPGAQDPLVTQASLLAAVADQSWVAKTVEEGDGVTFDDLVRETGAALAAFDVPGAQVEGLRFTEAGPQALDRLRSVLAENERSADDVLLVYFNQGVLTGDWDGPHISPVGAYDAGSDRVLVMDVDRQWYVPYWAPVPKLLEAMTKPTGPEHGPLAGETGGLVHATLAP